MFINFSKLDENEVRRRKEIDASLYFPTDFQIGTNQYLMFQLQSLDSLTSSLWQLYVIETNELILRWNNY